MSFSSVLNFKQDDGELKRPANMRSEDQIAPVDDAMDYLRVRMQSGESN